MASVYRTRDCFLWFMSLVYLFAFSSLYIQIPGLYGDNGILPAKLALSAGEEGEDEDQQGEDVSWDKIMSGQPSLLKLVPRLGLDVQTGMDLLCLAGMLVAFLAVVSRTARDFVSFTLLWMFYLSVYQVGQTFLWFQWDILLLEAGFLTILIAPFNMQMLGKRWPTSNPHDGITMWLARWLLFRLMFASGVVKLTSQCPTWWGLTALSVHFESQCIPSPAAWYWHHLPGWFLQLGVVATYVIEIAIPFLFFSPLRSLRTFAFWSQLLLQLLIIVTGNYNFFNMLTITLCIALLDDDCSFFYRAPYRSAASDKKKSSSLVKKLVLTIVPLAVIGFLLYWTVRLFSLGLTKDWTVHSKIAFSEAQFASWLKTVMPVTIYVGVASLAWEVITAVFRCVLSEKSALSKFIGLVGTSVFTTVAVFMFIISLVPLSYLDSHAYHSVPQQAKSWHSKVEPFQLANSYGLFRKMTGVGGRPELVLEGHPSDRSARDGWRVYEFLYKPGNLSRSPPVVAPHQPRLDWQMWFAALGNYQNNPWLLNLVYRLLQEEPDVLELLAYNPFPVPSTEEEGGGSGEGGGPKYIRATLYHYHYTSPQDCQETTKKCDWWKRERKAEYLPALSITDKSFVDYLKQARLLQDKEKRSPLPPDNWLAQSVHWCRSLIGQPEGFSFMVSMFGSAIMAMALNRAVF